MAYDNEEFERTKERVIQRWGPEITHPRLRAKIAFEDVIHVMLAKIAVCSEDEFDLNVHRLFWLIPESWKDDEFNTDIEDATEQVEYTEPVYCCGIEVNPDVLSGKREIREETDWRKGLNAIVNLLGRRDLLAPKSKTEVLTTKKEKENNGHDIVVVKE